VSTAAKLFGCWRSRMERNVFAKISPICSAAKCALCWIGIICPSGSMRASPFRCMASASEKSWQHTVLSHLWQGRVSEPRDFLSGLQARNPEALSDLIGYLTKHQEEILDYQRRQQSGKPIGSGPAEKAVDQVVGMRQKDQGMSWTKTGSRTLALLKV